MSKFTPGPWKTFFGETVRIRNSVKGTVAIITHLERRGRRKPEEARANSYLIAAAPDMYEALKIVCDECREVKEEINCGGCYIHDVLSRAEGRL